jgi:clan AA aspartic protease
MIVGFVSTDHEALVRVTVRAPDGQDHEIEAVLDTGFTGSLTLPPAVISEFGLAWQGSGPVVLANGATDQCDFYAADIIWDGRGKPILVDSADVKPLIGMDLLYGYEVRIEVTDGGSVTIEELPQRSLSFAIPAEGAGGMAETAAASTGSQRWEPNFQPIGDLEVAGGYQPIGRNRPIGVDAARRKEDKRFGGARQDEVGDVGRGGGEMSCAGFDHQVPGLAVGVGGVEA